MLGGMFNTQSNVLAQPAQSNLFAICRLAAAAAALHDLKGFVDGDRDFERFLSRVGIRSMQ